MNVYEAFGSNAGIPPFLELPVEGLFLLAAPSTPEPAREEIVERAGQSIDKNYRFPNDHMNGLCCPATPRPQPGRRQAFRLRCSIGSLAPEGGFLGLLRDLDASTPAAPGYPARAVRLQRRFQPRTMEDLAVPLAMVRLPRRRVTGPRQPVRYSANLQNRQRCRNSDCQLRGSPAAPRLRRAWFSLRFFDLQFRTHFLSGALRARKKEGRLRRAPGSFFRTELVSHEGRRHA